MFDINADEDHKREQTDKEMAMRGIYLGSKKTTCMEPKTDVALNSSTIPYYSRQVFSYRKFLASNKNRCMSKTFLANTVFPQYLFALKFIHLCIVFTALLK